MNRMRVALGLEYAGTAYRGWQRQAVGATLQAAVETAVAAVAGEPVAITAAGRTDTGVHATQQVVHFDAPTRPLSAWVRGVNSHLPPDIAVRWSREVSADFHARFSATARRYRYYLLNRAERPGILSGRVGWYHRPLDAAAMQQAVASLVGEQDFSSFRAAECQANSPVRTMYCASVRHEGDFLIFDFQANAFLHHMIRNIVGALVYVGNGKHAPEWVPELLAQRDRTRAAPTFAADGLYLAGVDYPAEFGLPCATMALFPWEPAV